MVEVTIAVILSIIVIGIIGAVKYYEKKYGDNPQAWDTNKFLLLLVIGTGFILVEYYYSGIIQAFPGEEILQPALAAFSAAYFLIFGAKAVKNYTDTGGVPTPIPNAPVVNPSWSFGFTVTPTESIVKSGTPVTFHLNVGHDAQGVDVPNVLIDWMDGTPLQTVAMQNNFTQVAHTYNYNAAGTQYDAKVFYPEFTLLAADHTTAVFNTDGKCCWVECKSLVPA